MHAVTGIILAIVVIWGVYALYTAGFFEPLTTNIGAIVQGYQLSLGEPPHSTYYHAVRIRFVALGEENKPGDTLALVAHPAQGGMDVTGWSLKTDKGVFKIPQTYNVYSPSTKDALPEDIFMRDGDRITFYGIENPGDARNERVTQSEYRIWFKDFLKGPHGNIILRDQKGILVDQYAY